MYKTFIYQKTPRDVSRMKHFWWNGFTNSLRWGL